MGNEQYKLGGSRFSEHFGYPVVDIYKRKRFLGFPYWSHNQTIRDARQGEEVVFLLNNPQVAEHRIKQALQSLNQ